MYREKQNNKILDISNVLTPKEKKMLENVGYVLLSGNIAKRVDNSKNFKIKRIDNILLLQLDN